MTALPARLKSASTLALTALLLAAGAVAAPQAALADTTASSSGLAPGTYTVSANVYVAASDTPIGQNAYVTNSGTPPLNMPTSPVAANATLQVLSDGTELVTVPIVNTTFGVLSIASSSTDGSVDVTSTSTSSWATTWGGTKQRVSSVTFDVTDFDGGTDVATFSPSSEYADFLLYVGTKSWDLHLVVDFDSAS
jgi:hypothetical protein